MVKISIFVEQERIRLLAKLNSTEFDTLPPLLRVPVLATDTAGMTPVTWAGHAAMGNLHELVRQGSPPIIVGRHNVALIPNGH